MKVRVVPLLLAVFMSLTALWPAHALAGGGGGSSPKITVKNAARKTIMVFAATGNVNVKGGYYTPNGAVPVFLSPGSSFSDDYKGAFDFRIQANSNSLCACPRFDSLSSRGSFRVHSNCQDNWADVTYTMDGDSVNITINAISF